MPSKNGKGEIQSLEYLQKEVARRKTEHKERVKKEIIALLEKEELILYPEIHATGPHVHRWGFMLIDKER